MSEVVRVVKVGGSLLELSALANVVRRWLVTRPLAKSILIAGGGSWTDAVRKVDAVHGLGEEASHWLCIRALGVTARLLAALMSEATLIDEFDALRRWVADGSTSSIAVFDLESFLRVQEPGLGPSPLPHTWEVTTDSLAARVAEALAADLVLLKACDPPLNDNLGAWALAGYVDPWFPHVASRLRCVRAVNLCRFAETDPL